MLKLVGYAALAIVACALLVLPEHPAQACTGIRIEAEDGSVVYARTMEFGVNLDSHVLFLPRGYEFIGSTASGKPGLTWNAKFAAVGLNAFDADQLVDGVNEQGLAAGGFYLPGYADYQVNNPGDEPQTIAPWEVITWILTNFSTVDEVRAALSGIRVGAAPLDADFGVPPLHYIAHDATGNSLVIEYVDGQLHTYDNPIGVITNSPSFDWHITNLRNYINLTATNVPPVLLDHVRLSQFGQGSGLKGLPGDFTPPSRFVRAVALSQNALPGRTGLDSVKTAFHILDSFDIPRGVVRPGQGEHEPYEFTQWTSASDLKNRRYYFHTYDNRRVRSVDLNGFDLDARQPVSIAIDQSDAIEDLTPESAVQ